MLSWRYQTDCNRSRRSAKGSGRGAAGGSSVHPDTAAPVDCGTFLAALTERLFRSLTSSHQQDFLFSLSLTPQRRPTVPERQLPATPAIGPLSSESIVPMLLLLLRCLTPAQTKLVCLWCPTSSARYCGGCGAAEAPCLFNTAFKLSAAFTATLVLASPRPVAESAHNKTLQSSMQGSSTSLDKHLADHWSLCQETPLQPPGLVLSPHHETSSCGQVREASFGFRH